MTYCALIGDVCGSRKVTDRAALQKTIYDALDEVNRRYRAYIAADFLVTLGDEFQGLLFTPGKAFEIIELLSRRLYPVRFRCGIGVGEITTAIKREMALGADGPAFYYARSMIEAVKQSETEKKSQRPQVLFYSGKPEDILINQLAVLYKDIEADWKDTQRRVAYAVMDSENPKQETIARLTGLSQSVISRALTGGRYYKYSGALSALEEYLTEHFQMEEK